MDITEQGDFIIECAFSYTIGRMQEQQMQEIASVLTPELQSYTPHGGPT